MPSGASTNKSDPVRDLTRSFVDAMEEHRQGRAKKAIMVYKGQHPGMGEDPKGVRHYMSVHKEAMLFNGEKYAIKFAQHNYITNDPEEIKFIESHSSFAKTEDDNKRGDKTIFRDKFPKHIVQKFRKDKEEITRREDMFEPPS